MTMTTDADYRAYLAEDYFSAKLGRTSFERIPFATAAAGEGQVHAATFDFSGPLARKLSEVARGSAANAYALLTAGCFHLLHKYGLTHVLVASPGFAPNPAGNLLFFTHHFAPAPANLRELVRTVVGQVREVAGYQQYDFRRLRQSLALRQPEQVPGLRELGLALQGCTALDPEVLDRFGLCLLVRGEGDRRQLEVRYQPAAYAPGAVERMGGHFLEALGNVLFRPDEPLPALSVLTASEKHQLLTERNDTATGLPLVTITEALARQARLTPDRPALHAGDRVLDFAALHAGSDRVAGRLRECCSLSPNDVVAVLLPRTEGLVMGLWGVLKTGAAYLPLDPSYPAGRLQYMLTNSGCKAVLTVPAYLGLLETGSPLPVVLPEDSFAAAEAGAAADPAGTGDLDAMAYLMYTSGSTGQPKGVKVSHGNLASFCLGMDLALPLDASDHLLAVTPASFDISILELLWTLSRGIPVTLVKDVYHLAGAPDLGRPTVLQTTPSLLKVLLQNAASAPLLAALKYILAGGEKLPPELAGELRRKTNARLYNMYGPTETTIWSACREILPGEEVSVGRPIANTRLYVLDASGNPVPDGVAGEICIGGPGVAMGYLDAPALTAEKFVPDPWAAQPGARLYRTGDVGYWLPSGDLQVAGRVDHQVKIRGHRVEPGEVEAALLGYAPIRQALVVPRTGRDGTVQLAAYLRSETPLTLPPLLRHLHALLPAHLVPSWFVPLDRVPLTPNGKADLKALPDPETAALGNESPAAFAGSAVAAQLTALWQSVLERSRVGPYDNLLELGANSLKIIQAFNQAREHFPELRTVAELFDHPSVAQQAELILGRQGAVRAPLPVHQVLDF